PPPARVRVPADVMMRLLVPPPTAAPNVRVPVAAVPATVVSAESVTGAVITPEPARRVIVGAVPVKFSPPPARVTVLPALSANVRPFSANGSARLLVEV